MTCIPKPPPRPHGEGTRQDKAVMQAGFGRGGPRGSGAWGTPSHPLPPESPGCPGCCILGPRNGPGMGMSQQRLGGLWAGSEGRAGQQPVSPQQD